MIWTYVIIAAIDSVFLLRTSAVQASLTVLGLASVLLIAELVYFKIADHFNIIDKPNERSSHSTIVLRGGGIIFAISMIVWFGWQMVNGSSALTSEATQASSEGFRGFGGLGISCSTTLRKRPCGPSEKFRSLGE